MLPSQPSHALCESETLQSLTLLLTQKPKSCWAREHMAPARIQRRTWISSESVCSMVRPYCIRKTCQVLKTCVCPVITFASLAISSLSNCTYYSSLERLSTTRRIRLRAALLQMKCEMSRSPLLWIESSRKPALIRV